MQLGGNANAVSEKNGKFSYIFYLDENRVFKRNVWIFQASFFRHHNCNTTDTQTKYKSRAAQLYRDKLHGEANKAMRIHGTKLFINAPQTSKNDDEDEENKEDEADFFEKHSEDTSNIEASRNVSLAKSVAVRILFFY